MVFDSTLSFMRSPYQYISSTAKDLETKVFETRLLLERTICMYGKDAAQLFTDESLFTRKGAAPELVRATLLGKGGLQGLDGEAHIHRKALFMSFNSPDRLYHLRSLVVDWLDIYSSAWQQKQEVILYDEFKEILTRAVCSWAGLELSEDEVELRTSQLSNLFDVKGPLNHFSSRGSRKQSESWICEIVRLIREGKHIAPEGSPLYQFAFFKDHKGELLSPKIAAVEFLNLLRPTVAVSLYFVFCCHALHLNPQHRQRLKAQEIGELDRFVNEVRRYYPFFPALFAKVRSDFEWNGFLFKEGARVMLDVYGTNHDPDSWEDPYQFNPDRFKNWSGSAFSFIPQGVGDHYVDHRCPGELIAIELMRSLVEFFVNRIDYTVPKQNLSLDMSRLPAAPRDQMKITNVRRVQLYTEQFV